MHLNQLIYHRKKSQNLIKNNIISLGRLAIGQGLKAISLILKMNRNSLLKLLKKIQLEALDFIIISKNIKNLHPLLNKK